MGERRLVVLIDDVDGTGDDAAVLSARQREGEKPWLTAFYGAMKNAQSLLGMRVFAVGENPLGVVGMVSGRRSFSQCDDGRSVCRAVWKSRTGF